MGSVLRSGSIFALADAKIHILEKILWQYPRSFLCVLPAPYVFHSNVVIAKVIQCPFQPYPYEMGAACGSLWADGHELIL